MPEQPTQPQASWAAVFHLFNYFLHGLEIAGVCIASCNAVKKQHFCFGILTFPPFGIYFDCLAEFRQMLIT